MADGLALELSVIINVFKASKVSLLPSITCVLLTKRDFSVTQFFPKELIAGQRLSLDREPITKSSAQFSLDVMQFPCIEKLKNLIILVFAQLHEGVHGHILWIHFKCLK